MNKEDLQPIMIHAVAILLLEFAKSVKPYLQQCTDSDPVHAGNLLYLCERAINLADTKLPKEESCSIC